jgi:hypothetical protein
MPGEDAGVLVHTTGHDPANRPTFSRTFPKGLHDTPGMERGTAPSEIEEEEGVEQFCSRPRNLKTRELAGNVRRNSPGRWFTFHTKLII